jgi:hypothetical protein
LDGGEPAGIEMTGTLPLDESAGSFEELPGLPGLENPGDENPLVPGTGEE